jgi:hypothetical protein
VSKTNEKKIVTDVTPSFVHFVALHPACLIYICVFPKISCNCQFLNAIIVVSIVSCVTSSSSLIVVDNILLIAKFGDLILSN